jgi:hypothetical protein
MSIHDSDPEPRSRPPIASVDDGKAVPAHDQLKLGREFAKIVRHTTSAYIANYGDGRRTRLRARDDAFVYIMRLHPISKSTVRLYINMFERFYAMPRAIESLRQTDMQLLLGADIGDDIVDAVIERRVTDPTVSTRTVKQLIDSLRRGGRTPDAPAV